MLRKKPNKTRFFFVLYSDKTWVFDQSERAQGHIYIINGYVTYKMYFNYDGIN